MKQVDMEKGKTMSDYIKREDAIKAFDPSQRRDWYTPWIVEILKDLPSVDVAPVRHGRWIDEEPTVIKCSACGEEFNDEIVYMTNPYNNLRYCPGCGAKMDVGDVDE